MGTGNAGQHLTAQPTPSPCTRVCQLDEAMGSCIGCGRTREEIAIWGSAEPADRTEVSAHHDLSPWLELSPGYVAVAARMSGGGEP